MMGISFLHSIWHTVQYMLKLLTYDLIRICIWSDLCYEIHIQQMGIFLGFITSVVGSPAYKHVL